MQDVWKAPLCYSTLPSKESWRRAGRRQTGSSVMSLSWQDVEDTRLSWSFEMYLWSFCFAAIPINLCFKQFLKLCFLFVFRRGSQLGYTHPVRWKCVCVSYSFDLLTHAEEVGMSHDHMGPVTTEPQNRLTLTLKLLQCICN